MKNVIRDRPATIPIASPEVQRWCAQENRANSNLHDDLEDQFSKIAVVKKWTPAITFATPGNLSVSYSTQVGDIVRTKDGVVATFRIITSAFSWTTSAGVLQITGLPYTASTLANDSAFVWQGALVWGGVTKANYTHMVSQISANTNYIVVGACGSAQAPANLVAADLPSGGSVVLSGNVAFRIRP